MSLSAAQRKSLMVYVYGLAEKLDLRDWRISIADEPVDEGAEASAQVTAASGRKACEIELASDFAKKPREEQREILVHELIHLHFEPMALLVEDMVRKSMGREGASLFSVAFIQGLEYGVDGLALAIAPLFPLPPMLGKASQ